MNKKANCTKWVIVFDGHCKLCSGLVQFLIKWDSKDCFRFTSLQSDSARQILSPFHIPSDYSESIILIADDTIYLKSDAVFKITSKLGGFWTLLPAFKIIPRFMRDYFYDFIAKHRYKWFGKKKSCFIPTENQKYKFNIDNYSY